MRLTFVCPVYKPKEDIFTKHVKSLANQALKDFDVIWVLDGPSDLATKIIDKHMDGKEYTILEVPQGGAQKARNAGCAMAKGDFLCVFDSDCILEPGASQMWVEQFDKHPEVGFIYSSYKFVGEKVALESRPWDPWLHKIRPFISGCFPMRKSLYPGWTEGLKSLQDWDMWLSLVEKAEEQGMDVNKLGMYVPGYAFATPLPDPESISGQGCTEENWLNRVKAVKTLHGLKDRDVCVTSLQYPHDGIALAKLLDADYQDLPSNKPDEYKTIIQVGFSLGQNVEKHSAIFQKPSVKKVLFWTGDNINEMWHGVSFSAIDSMSKLLNDVATQYCEDREAKRLLTRLGFNVEIMPLPIGKPNILPMPEKKAFAVDIAGTYSPMISVIAQSLPDIRLDMVGEATQLSDYRGLIHFFQDKTISNSMKRAILTGRHVVSNVQQPYCGFVDDRWDVEKFVVEMVDKIRTLANQEPDAEAAKYYAGNVEKLKEVVNA